MTTRPPTRPPAPRSSTRRDQLTAIAAGLFARDGYHNVTVGDIAAAAGLSGPATPLTVLFWRSTGRLVDSLARRCLQNVWLQALTVYLLGSSVLLGAVWNSTT